jgi:hypothetical protein
MLDNTWLLNILMFYTTTFTTIQLGPSNSLNIQEISLQPHKKTRKENIWMYVCC